jgi:hypothetical protein
VKAPGKNNQAASSRGFRPVIGSGLQRLVVVAGERQRDELKIEFLRIAK